MNKTRQLIETSFEDRAHLGPDDTPPELRAAVEQALDGIERGELRVAEKRDGQWRVNEWLKKAVLLSFRIHPNRVIRDGYTSYYDKVAPKYSNYGEQEFAASGVRVVPPAAARHGTYIAPGVVLMPSYVNIGAYVDSGTMVDTWATVGSCAQIGRNVHLSGGVGIGGVLEPLQASGVSCDAACDLPGDPGRGLCVLGIAGGHDPRQVGGQEHEGEDQHRPRAPANRQRQRRGQPGSSRC